MKFVILTCSLVSGNPLLRLSQETERLNIKHKGFFLAVFGDPVSLVQPTLQIQPLFSAPLVRQKCLCHFFSPQKANKRKKKIHFKIRIAWLLSRILSRLDLEAPSYINMKRRDRATLSHSELLE